MQTIQKFYFWSSQHSNFNINIKINQNFSENSIQLWEIDKTYAKIELKDLNVIIRSKPMRCG